MRYIARLSIRNEASLAAFTLFSKRALNEKKLPRLRYVDATEDTTHVSVSCSRSLALQKRTRRDLNPRPPA